MSETDEKKQNGKKDGKRNGFRRCLWWIAGIAVILAILLLGPAKPQRIAMEAGEEEALLIENVVDKLSDSLCSEDNQILPVSTVALSAEEINALLAVGIRGYQQSCGSGYSPVLFAYADGDRIRVEVSQPLICGLGVNGYVSVHPEVRDHQLRLSFSGIRAGWIPMPGALVSGIVSKLLGELENREEYVTAMKVIVQAEMQENGTLSLTFIPAEISSLIAILTD